MPLSEDVAAQVADRLQLSRQMHGQWRQHIPHVRNVAGSITPQAGDAAQAGTALVAAQQARLDAHALDPTHEAAAWADDLAAGFPHAELVMFYAAKLR